MILRGHGRNYLPVFGDGPHAIVSTMFLPSRCYGSTAIAFHRRSKLPLKSIGSIPAPDHFQQRPETPSPTVIDCHAKIADPGHKLRWERVRGKTLMFALAKDIRRMELTEIRWCGRYDENIAKSFRI
jgi:hypothetical protein